MRLDRTWPSIEDRLRVIAEGGGGISPAREDGLLAEVGLIDANGLTALGTTYYLERHVRRAESSANDILREAIAADPIVGAFQSALWGRGDIPIEGAISLLKRLGAAFSDIEGRRLLELMGRVGLLVYNRNRPVVRVAVAPVGVRTDDEAAKDESVRGYVLSPDTKFSNVLALRRTLRGARAYLYWYEPHLGAKVLEVLQAEIDREQLKEIRLLSGPAQISDGTKRDFELFRQEMQSVRRVAVNWRILDKDEASRHHGRFIVTEGYSKNLPPLNLILKGTTDEILPSSLSSKDFTAIWDRGTDLDAFAIPAPARPTDR